MVWSHFVELKINYKSFFFMIYFSLNLFVVIKIVSTNERGEVRRIDVDYVKKTLRFAVSTKRVVPGFNSFMWSLGVKKIILPHLAVLIAFI